MPHYTISSLASILFFYLMLTSAADLSVANSCDFDMVVSFVEPVQAWNVVIQNSQSTRALYTNNTNPQDPSSLPGLSVSVVDEGSFNQTIMNHPEEWFVAVLTPEENVVKYELSNPIGNNGNRSFVAAQKKLSQIGGACVAPALNADTPEKMVSGQCEGDDIQLRLEFCAAKDNT